MYQHHLKPELAPKVLWAVVLQCAIAALPFLLTLLPPTRCVYPGMGRKGSGGNSGKERNINNLLFKLNQDQKGLFSLNHLFQTGFEAPRLFLTR